MFQDTNLIIINVADFIVMCSSGESKGLKDQCKDPIEM